MTVGETTEEIDFFGGEVETKKSSLLLSALKTVAIISACSGLTVGYYVVLTGLVS